jgi:hypothetical protein
VLKFSLKTDFLKLNTYLTNQHLSDPLIPRENIKEPQIQVRQRYQGHCHSTPWGSLKRTSTDWHINGMSAFMPIGTIFNSHIPPPKKMLTQFSFEQTSFNSALKQVKTEFYHEPNLSKILLVAYKNRIAVLTSVCQKSLAQERAHWSGYLPGPWRTVCASMDTSCLVEFPLSWQNRSSK